MIAVAFLAAIAWQYNDAVDPMTDFVRPIAVVDAPDGAFLALKCDKPGKGQTYAQVHSPEFLGGAGARAGMRQIAIRYDDTPAVEDYWLYNDHYAVAGGQIRRQRDEFIRRISSASTVTFKLVRYDGKVVYHRFDLAGTRDAISRTFMGCQDGDPLKG